MLSAIVTFLLILLKILGGLLGFLLLILLGILILPIRYQLDGVHTEESPPYAKAKVTWIFSLLRCYLEYKEGALVYQVRVFGHTFLTNHPDQNSDKKQKKKKKEKKKTKQQTRPASNNSIKSEDTIQDTSQDTQQDRTQETKQKIVPETIPEIKSETKSEIESETTSYRKEENPSTDHTDTSALNTLNKKEKKQKKSKKAKKTSTEGKIATLQRKWQELKEKADEYQVRVLLQIAKDTGLRILKHIAPRRLHGWVHFGLEDPSVTGQVTAVAALFYPVYGKHFTLEPDFTKVCLEGDVHAKGRIRVGFFVYIIVGLLTKKEIRNIIHLVLKK